MRLNHERGLPRAAAGARGQPLVSVKKKHKATSKNHSNKLKNDKKITTETRKTGKKKHGEARRVQKRLQRRTSDHKETQNNQKDTKNPQGEEKTSKQL